MRIGETYETIGKPIGSGGYAYTYLAVGPDGQKHVIKLPNLDTTPRRSFGDIDQRVEEFNRSLKAEFRSLHRLARISCVAHALYLGTHTLIVRGEVLCPHFIVQEFVEGFDLDAYLKSASFRRHATLRRDRFSGIKTVTQYLCLASKLITALADVHKLEVAHGDIWPRNIRIRPNGEPVIIDFGSSRVIDLVLSATGEPISHAYAAPERRDPSGRWGAGADIYSLGGVLFFMATGQEPPNPPIEDWDDLKSTIASRIKRFNPALYSENSGIADVIARCMRYSDRDRPSFPEVVLEELCMYLLRPSERLPKLRSAMGLLDDSLGQLKKDRNGVFAHIAAARVRTLARQFQEMKAGLYTLGGHYENIARGLVEALSLLEVGDTYITVSVPSFWGRNSIGRNGRFLEMNKVVAQRGVNIGRVFLLTPDDLASDEVYSILQAQSRVAQELQQRKIDTQQWRASVDPRGFYTGVYVDRERSKHRELEFTNFGIWSKAGSDEAVLVLPAYREKEKNIAAVRLWAPELSRERVAQLKKQAMSLLFESTPLDDVLKRIRDTRGPEKVPNNRREPQRILCDSRQKVSVTWQRVRGAVRDTRATVQNHSPNGVCLGLSMPSKEAPYKGDTMRLTGPAPFNSEWARRLWDRDLEVMWKKSYRPLNPPCCIVGLQKKNP